jgi:hypothetical protein
MNRNFPWVRNKARGLKWDLRTRPQVPSGPAYIDLVLALDKPEVTEAMVERFLSPDNPEFLVKPPAIHCTDGSELTTDEFLALLESAPELGQSKPIAEYLASCVHDEEP